MTRRCHRQVCSIRELLSASMPAMQILSPFPNSMTPSKRQSDGRLSWMATLVPKIDMYSGSASDEFILSVVMFYDRPTDLRLSNPTGNQFDATATENILERVV